MSLSPASTVEELIAHLKSLRSAENIAGIARFGVVTDHALGISTPHLRAIARTVKRNHVRALALYDSGIREARLLAAYTEEPENITPDEARALAAGFNSWELVDSWAEVFGRLPFAPLLIAECAGDEREFVRRMAFSMIVWRAVHLKTLQDSIFLDHLPLIDAHAGDPRNFVKKAVSWALRQIGKRNAACHASALALARRLTASEDATARWIGKDAVRELESEAVLRRVGRRSVSLDLSMSDSGQALSRSDGRKPNR